MVLEEVIEIPELAVGGPTRLSDDNIAVLRCQEGPFAWNLAHSPGLDDERTWRIWPRPYEKIDALQLCQPHPPR